MNDAIDWAKSVEVCSALAEVPLVCKDQPSAYRRICELGQQALESRACTLVLVNLEDGWWEQVGCVGFDVAYEQHLRGRRNKLGSVTQGGRFDDERAVRGEPVEAYGLMQDGQGLVNPTVAQRYDLNSVYCCPLRIGDNFLGYFNHFSSHTERFTEEEKSLVQAFARHTAIVCRTLDNLQQATTHQRLARLNQVMLEATEVHDVDQLLKLVLGKGLDLIGCSRGTISRLNPKTGMLDIVAHRGGPPDLPSLHPGQGITGQVLENERSIRVDDVEDSRWAGIYVRLWPDTRSELAVPIVIYNAEIRVGDEIRRASKPIGVFNVESPDWAAFSPADQDLLDSLARYAALLIDRLEFDRKVTDLDRIRRKMIGLRPWDDIFQVVMDTITSTLGYDYVNISLVDRERGRIKTEYVTGIPREQVEDFKRRADHLLDSTDIQADIVHSRRIEVPAADDPRFDTKIYQRFGHDKLVRVYLPMVAPSGDRVLGTVETGYRRRPHLKHIYEQDVRILTSFVDYAARALEQMPRDLLDQITHELRSPVVGIRNNASFLQRRLPSLRANVVEHKFNDILRDCDMLLNQVKELEYILGRRALRSSKVVRTFIFRDVIIKTVRQLNPTVTARGFDHTHVQYDETAIHRISPLYVDPSLLNEVVYNLLINATKYAEDNPDRFAIRISVDQTRDAFVVIFKDWGIGIRPEYVDRIFDEGFRTPEARQCDVNGSGLGLTIARRIMRELGGDLRLANRYKPTEFHIILPRYLMEAPDDSHDR